MAKRLSETAPKMLIAATASLAAVGIVYLATSHAPAQIAACPAVETHVIHIAPTPPPPPPTPIIVEPARPYPAPHK